MDDRKRELIKWVVAHKNKFKLSIVNYSWPERWLRDYYDFKVKIYYNDYFYEGRGSDVDEETALVKAIMEAFERILIRENNLKNSNGVALHFDLDSAKYNAAAELLERDSFLCHYLTKIPPRKIIENIPTLVQECLKKFESKNVNSCVFNLTPGNDYFVTMTLSTGVNAKNPFGLCLGLGADKEFSKSVMKSSLECIRHVTAHLESESFNYRSFTFEDFMSLKDADVVDHIKYANNPDIGYKIYEQFNEGNSEKLKETRANISFTELKLPDFFSHFSLKGIRADSVELQNLFFGATDKEKINFPRLIQFADQPLEFDHLNKWPHPLG